MTTALRNTGGRQRCWLGVLVTLAIAIASPLAVPGELADPTAPSPRVPQAVAREPSVEYRLSGIWWRAGSGSAVVNGVTVTAGAVVDGATVVAVGAEQVRLRLGDGTVTTLRSAPQVARRGDAGPKDVVATRQ